MAPPVSHLDLNLSVCAASLGTPMIALVLVPPDVSRVSDSTYLSISKNICVHPTPQKIDDVNMKPRALTELTPPQGETHSGNAKKFPCDPRCKQTGKVPKKQAKAEAGPSRLVVTGYPQQVSGGQDLLVLPPIPRDIYDELTSSHNGLNSSLTEPETSKDEQERRRMGLKS
ncbi:hypothetical protein EDB86DRAFT_2838796 [Lactarius hatsudake]|nr:hypothetical protein EDB86DRAFT_2838796 [Lactarius hatsudake]